MTPEVTRRPTDVGIASLVTDTTALEVENTKHKIHYLWFPYVDIPIVGPDGLRMRLGKGMNYYGVGKPGEDFGLMVGRKKSATAAPRPEQSRPPESAEEYNERLAGFLMRCDPLPIWDIAFLESRFNHGRFSDREWEAGNTMNADIDEEEVAVAAGVCAADFLQRYEVSHGARVLLPLIGMDEAEIKTARELVRLVQPKPHKLTNLRQEQELGYLDDEETLLFDLSDNGPAHERIVGARLDRVLTKKAHDLRAIMLSGVRQALVQAYADWEDLLFQLSNAAMGHKENKRSVSPYDRQVAWLLGETPPANVAAKPAGDPELKKAVGLLTDLATKQQTSTEGRITIDAADLKTLVDQAVEQRLAQGKKAKPPTGEGTT